MRKFSDFDYVTNADWHEHDPTWPLNDTWPVTNITHTQASEFCKKYGYRLPTEDELNKFLVENIVSTPYYFWTSTKNAECKVVLGGSFYFVDRLLHFSNVGFRVVRDTPALAELHKAVESARNAHLDLVTTMQSELNVVHDRYAERIAFADAAYGQAYARLRAHPQYVPED